MAKLEWATSKVAALARQPGQHPHPTRTGLFMRVSETKKKAVYGYRFRDVFGDMQNDTLGEVAEGGVLDGITFESAEKQFDKLWKYHKNKGTKGGLTLAIAFQFWQEKSTKRGGGVKSPVTTEYYQELYSRYFEPKYADLVLDKTTPEVWMTVLDAARARSPNQARGAYWMLHSIYALYVELETLEKNPLAKKTLRNKFSGGDLTGVVRTTQVKAINLTAFWNGLQSLGSRSKQSKRVIAMLLLTGWRLSAICGLRWKQFDFKAGTYNVLLHDKGWKGYVGLMALNEYALNYVKERRAEGGEAESEYVFPSHHGDKGHMSDVRGAMENISQKVGYKVNPHDLRRTYATVGDVFTGANTRLVGILQGQKQPKQKDSSATSADYIVRDLKAEGVTARALAECILQLADVLPLDDEIEAAFKKRGVDIREIELKPMEDDDTSD
jgi:integrase